MAVLGVLLMLVGGPLEKMLSLVAHRADCGPRVPGSMQ